MSSSESGGVMGMSTGGACALVKAAEVLACAVFAIGGRLKKLVELELFGYIPSFGCVEADEALSKASRLEPDRLFESNIDSAGSKNEVPALETGKGGNDIGLGGVMEEPGSTACDVRIRCIVLTAKANHLAGYNFMTFDIIGR